MVFNSIEFLIFLPIVAVSTPLSMLLKMVGLVM